MFRAFSTNDTVSGVSAGWAEHAAFFSAAAVMPCGTAAFAGGLVAPLAGTAAMNSSSEPAEPTAERRDMCGAA